MQSDRRRWYYVYGVSRSLKAKQLSTAIELKGWSQKLLLHIILSISARKHKALAIQMNIKKQ